MALDSHLRGQIMYFKGSNSHQAKVKRFIAIRPIINGRCLEIIKIMKVFVSSSDRLHPKFRFDSKKKQNLQTFLYKVKLM